MTHSDWLRAVNLRPLKTDKLDANPTTELGLLNRGSFMSAYFLLNLLNEFSKNDKNEPLASFYRF